MGRDERRLAAILAADVAGYSRLMAADEPGTLARFKLLRSDHVEPALYRHGGRVVGEAGDSLLVEFGAASAAVVCAVEIQAKLAELNAELPEDRRMRFRMGVNLGEVIVDGTTIHGDGVNIAARLEKLAEPGGVCVSHTVHDQVEGKLPHVFTYLGEQQVKNIAKPVRAYRVDISEPTQATAARGEDARRRQSIAVLPFANMSGDPEQEYFSDGITEDLIAALARYHGLFVIARNSSFVFKGKAVSIPEAARQLGVRYIVEGSVRKSGKRIRITAQLIDAETGAHLWAEKYDRDLEDVFALQDEIVETLVWRVDGHVTKAEVAVLKRKRAPPVDAYELYLAGMELLNRHNLDDTRRARELFEHATVMDPSFGRAFFGLASAKHMIRNSSGGEFSYEEVYALLMKAIECDDSDADAYALLAYICPILGRDGEADACMEKALAINPNNPNLVTTAGWIHVWRGELDKALASAERGIRLRPLSVPWDMNLVATVAFLRGQYEEAWRALSRTPVIETTFQNWLLAATLAELGRLDDARKHMAEAIRLRPQFSASDRGAFYPFRPDLTAKFVEALRKVGLPE